MIGRKLKICGILIACLLAVSLFSMKYLFTLENIERWIEQYFSVQQIASEELHSYVTTEKSADYVVFDVRTPEEFTQSRIQSAVRINPKMSAEKFNEIFGSKISGKHLVFYCSVGGRSSILASRIKHIAVEHRAASVQNLRGGIFRWYNKGFPVYNDSGEVNEVHPYGVLWQHLLKKNDKKK